MSILLGFLTPFVIVTLLWLDGVGPIGLGFGVLLGGPRLTGLLISIGLSALLLVVMLLRWLVLRRNGLSIAAAISFCAGCFLALSPANRMGYFEKFYVAERLTHRSAPVVAAIEAFVVHEGAPPQTLADLVPDYLPALPTTGSPLYPDYILMSGADAEFGNPWILQIEMFDMMKWDALYYCPKQNCTQMGGGGFVQMDKWVFLDE